MQRTEESNQNIKDYVTELLEFQMRKKEIDEEIKALKQEYKDRGVAVSVVTTCVNKIKAQKKKTDSERFEEEMLIEMLESDINIDNSIGELASK